MKTTTTHLLPPPQRRRDAVAFIIETATKLETPPIIKYSALSLFTNKFLPKITTKSFKNPNYLLKNPQNQSTLQLFSLISIWISSKIHGSPPIQLKTLKSIGDCRIPHQHYTKTDYIDAENLFLQCVGFDIGTVRNSVFLIVEELLIEFKEVSKVGEMLNFEVCLDVIDLVYECERLIEEDAVVVAAGVVVAVFLVTVPKQRCEFPVVSWVKFVTRCSEDDIRSVARVILELICVGFV